MLPGPSHIYQCPNCDNLIKRGSLMSGNTFHSKLYSDGKRVAPMLPEFPDLTKCVKCGTILWLSKMKAIGTLKLGDKQNTPWKNADEAGFLSLDEYFIALNNGMAKTVEDELFIRRKIWWAYNDRVRNGASLFDDEGDESRWGENCAELIKLLDSEDTNQRIMIAELRRNLGDFEACLAIIEQIEDDALTWLKDIFIAECGKGNRFVTGLN